MVYSLFHQEATYSASRRAAHMHECLLAPKVRSEGELGEAYCSAALEMLDWGS